MKKVKGRGLIWLMYFLYIYEYGTLKRDEVTVKEMGSEGE
jgi:hypothetical protein